MTVELEMEVEVMSRSPATMLVLLVEVAVVVPSRSPSTVEILVEVKLKVPPTMAILPVQTCAAPSSNVGDARFRHRHLCGKGHESHHNS